MKLDFLSETVHNFRSILGTGLVGSANLEQELINAIGPAQFRKQMQPDLSDAATLQQKALPRRSGNQDTPLTPRHAKFFNQKQNAPAEAKAEFTSGLGAVGDTEFEPNEPLEPLDDEDPSNERTELKRLKQHGRHLPPRFSTDNSAIR
jgi:hypothetical protein